MQVTERVGSASQSVMLEAGIWEVGSSLVEVLGGEHMNEWLRWDGRKDHWG